MHVDNQRLDELEYSPIGSLKVPRKRMYSQKAFGKWLKRLFNTQKSSERTLLNIKDLYAQTGNRESELCTENLATNRIPNQVFQTWKSDFLDEEHYENLKNFQELNADYQFIFYNDKDMHEYMDSAWGHHPISSIFRRTKVGAAKADIWRYCILFDLGGIYLDIDASFRQPLSQIIGEDNSEIIAFEANQISMNRSRYRKQIDQDLLPFKDFVQMVEDLKQCSFPLQEHVVLQWALFFKPRHPILARVIEDITQNAPAFEGKVIHNMHKTICNLTGPIAYSKAVWQYALTQRIASRGIDFNGVGIPKNIPKKGVYKTDARHYSKLSGEILLEPEVAK
jgi:mannosyltransferase OCH1-like enzyme